MGLTVKQKLFVEAYLSNGFNATKAARTAGYSGNDAQLAVRGSETVRNRKVDELIQQRLKEAAMSANEVLARLSAMARGDLSEFVGLTQAQIKAHPQAYLLHKVKTTRQTYGSGDDAMTEEKVEIELYDAQAALNTLAKHHKLLTDRVEVLDARSMVIRDIQNGDVTYETLAEEFGNSLAAEWFRDAGVPAPVESGTGAAQDPA